MPDTQHLPIVVIACQVFQNLLELMFPEDLNDKISFTDYGLHKVPNKLNKALQERLDQIETASLVILGFGLCGNGLKNLKAGKHFLLVPRADDCIALLLGSYASYRKEFDSTPGTYYLSKGWLESGSNPLSEYEKYVETLGQENAMWIMDKQYQHYRRLVLVTHSEEDMAKYRPRALEVARFCERWGMQYEEILGSDSYVRKLAAAASNLDQVDDEFILVPPGGELKQSDFIRFEKRPDRA